MGDLGRRVEKLEEKVGVSPGEPRFIVHTLLERNEEGVVMERHPTKEALEKAKKRAMGKNPGGGHYFLMDFEEEYEAIIPEEQWRAWQGLSSDIVSLSDVAEKT